MKIGIISQWYPPEPAFIPASLAGELAARGHEVRVLTGFPNYPDGKIYPGYRQRWWDSTTGEPGAGGVTVRRVRLYPSHDNSPVRRAANYLSFAATSAAAAVRYLTDVDVLYVYHPPATSFTAALVLRLVRRIPTVLHVQDVWPDSVTASPLVPAAGASLVGQAVSTAMRVVYRSASSIAVTAPSMRRLLIERGADPAKVQVVLNWTDEALFRPVPPTEEARRIIGRRDRCTVMHAGNIGPFQDTVSAIHAAAAIRQFGLVDLVFVGSGIAEQSARTLAADLDADNVRFIPRQEPSAMAELYGAADFQLVSLRDLPILRGTIPSKLQAALSCGSPVLASAAGDCADLVERTGAGISSPPEDWPTLAENLLVAARLPPELRTGMGERARQSYQSQMAMTAGVNRLEEMLVTAAAGRRRP